MPAARLWNRCSCQLFALASSIPEDRNRFDRAVLVTVLGEIPDREAALREIFDALKPGGMLSVTEVIFDPHFQPRPTVARLARSVGFREQAYRVAFTLNLEKPRDPTTQST